MPFQRYDTNDGIYDYIPTIKDALIPLFNKLVYHFYKQSVKKDSNKPMILDKVIWKVLKYFVDDDEHITDHFINNNMKIWNSPIHKFDIIGLHKNLLTKATMCKIYQSSSAKSEQLANEPCLRPYNKKNKVQAKNSQWSPETVVKFMQECYISDSGDWIATKDIYDHYLKWIPEDQMHAPTCSVFSTAIPKDIYEPKRRQSAGYYVKLKDNSIDEHLDSVKHPDGL